MQVTDLPIWADCPLQQLIPSGLTIHRGSVNGMEIVALLYQSDETCFHVDFKMESFDEDSLKCAIRNIGGMRFEREFPNKFEELVNRNAEYLVAGKSLPAEDVKIWARYNELVSLWPGASAS